MTYFIDLKGYLGLTYLVVWGDKLVKFEFGQLVHTNVAHFIFFIVNENALKNQDSKLTSEEENVSLESTTAIILNLST